MYFTHYTLISVLYLSVHFTKYILLIREVYPVYSTHQFILFNVLNRLYYTYCNRLNSIITIRLRRGGMLSVNGRSHVLRHVTQRIVESWKGAQLIELR